MKNLKERLLTEGKAEYHVCWIGCDGADDLPIDATIILDKAEDAKFFEEFLKKEQDNIFSHATGGNVEY